MRDQSNNKRKGGQQGGPAFKKSKGGNGKKWQTPHQKAKDAERVELGTKLDTGDEGIWVTYARGMRGKSIREFKELCYQYGAEMFGVEKPSDEKEDDKDGKEEQDIEDAIEQELESMKAPQTPTTRQVFTPVGTGLECLFFMKTMKPVDPAKLVLRICEDARKCPDLRQRKTRYINRITPIVDTDKATENGIERVVRTVLGPHFEMQPIEGETDEKTDESNSGPAYTYAIRHNIRNHTTLKSDVVIKKIAGLVGPKHKVNLTSPDKVVLVEIFKTFCGVSVVDGRQWEDLKRYNVNEIYRLASEENAAKKNVTEESVAKETETEENATEEKVDEPVADKSGEGN